MLSLRAVLAAFCSGSLFAIKGVGAFDAAFAKKVMVGTLVGWTGMDWMDYGAGFLNMEGTIALTSFFYHGSSTISEVLSLVLCALCRIFIVGIHRPPRHMAVSAMKQHMSIFAAL